MKRFLVLAVFVGLVCVSSAAWAAPPHGGVHRGGYHDRYHDELDHRAYHRELDHREAHRYPQTPYEHGRLHRSLEREARLDRVEHRGYHQQFYRPAPRFGGYYQPSSRFSLWFNF